ncbi:MAG: ATP-binding cassette domain-containing protein, partial [bacterium]
MAPQFVFQTQNLTKQYNDKTVFENISLSFYYGAKIGIVGENGSGKTTLLRILAGVDADYM